MKESMARTIEGLLQGRFSKDVNKMFYVELQKDENGEIVQSNVICQKHNKPKICTIQTTLQVCVDCEKEHNQKENAIAQHKIEEEVKKSVGENQPLMSKREQFKRESVIGFVESCKN